MQRRELDHEIHCPPARLWQLYFDDAFNVEMYEAGLGFPSCKIAERTDDGETLHRRMVMIPKLEMPRAVAKLVGDKVGYEEIGDWVRSEGVFRWRLLLAAFGDKVRVAGTMRVVASGEARCRRLVEFEVEAKIFGVGALVEKTALNNTVDGWNASAAWINGYLARTSA
ncbi:hypothetical protein ENSA5_50620 [Enhygromyxa salina]|uniref:DUF2505 domain-containing protein n=1 Tax=Enhygromyxa salina TaxID=215803 RepID=A0A2S9XH53_9BACT|nr:DUF2505 family protein [Enhygromyxa salina]PRP92214.1 hypothetical protein ENSA5_50620 [Enhygromyxa salina]